MRHGNVSASVAVASLIAVLISALILPQGVYAAPIAAVVFQPFGGRISAVRFCNDGMLLTFILPRPAEVKVSYAKTRRIPPYGVPAAGIWALGIGFGLDSCVLGNVPVGFGIMATMIGLAVPRPGIGIGTF